MARAIVDGIGLEYLVEGTGPETVALLNGIGMSMAHWKPVVERLAGEGYRVVTHDLRGQLLSDKPAGPYSFETHARDLASLLSGLGVGRAHVIGTSYGAEVALTFARDFPAMCASVASIDGVTEYDAVLGTAIEAWRAAALSDPRVFYKSLVPWNYSASYITGHREALAQREDLVASLPRAYFEGFALLCDAFLAIDLTKDLGRIRCPCLALVASEDILKPPRYSRIIADGVPGAAYREIAGSGHAVVVEKPEALAEELSVFLRGARAG
ncbi:MAG: alpha/beta hydrolase [Spirochaetes bacterium]|nr:alpha/beta hydrolase [Spirochaetota bacterium]MBU1081409.1 alpha/beta hydrolase [Spirochaetota bacterium]